MRTNGHYAYDERVFHSLGVSTNFYKRFVVPTIFNIKGRKCLECNCSDNVQLHHSDLENININTLVPLCTSHHRKTHSDIKLGATK